MSQKQSPQSGILPASSSHARFLILRLGSLSLDELKAQLRELEDTRKRLHTQYINSHLSSVVGFGIELWKKLHQELPQGFHDLAPLSSTSSTEKLSMPSTGGDLVLHIHGEQADLCFLLAQTFMNGITDKVQILDERTGFRYLDRRDLTGFIDGTENPFSEDDRAEAALLGDGPCEGGSFVFSQRFVHDLQTWQRLKVDAQEHVMGRTKLESIELPDGVKPTNSHVARVVIEDDHGEELEILRHSLPYGNGSGEQGLFFHAYTKDLTVIDRMLARMYGVGDGITDRMLHFVTPVSGAYFFAPSQNLLDEIIEA